MNFVSSVLPSFKMPIIAALAAFNVITNAILQMETTPPKFSGIERSKLARTIAPVNSAMDAFLN